MLKTNGEPKSNDTAPADKSKDVPGRDKTADLTCGIIMPISLLDGCTADHWAEVKSIIVEAAESIMTPRFIPRLVSDADEIGVIQKRIVQNVYNSTIVVCDVSGKNPNVMFELGLRLAFDKPTVIIKDDKTDYSFDTGVIEHIPYPRDLRFAKIVEFKKKLADKVINTHKASVGDPHHSPFLKSFGQFHVASLAQSETSPEKVMFEVLSEIQTDVQVLKRRLERAVPSQPTSEPVPTTVFDHVNVIMDVVLGFCNRHDMKPSELFANKRASMAIRDQLSKQFPHMNTATIREAMRNVERILTT